MDKCDFTFRGESLSDHGYMPCDFDASSSTATATTDSQREFTSLSMFMGRYQPFLFYKYNDKLIMKAAICKSDGSDGYAISPTEAAAIKRWLCSPYASELKIGGTEYEGVFWRGSFHVDEVVFNSECIGFQLNFECTAPFGYKDLVTFSGSVTAAGTVTINDTSDEEGWIYPDITITPSEDGDLKITNAFDGRQTVIRNCSSGETIKLSHLLQIQSSDGSHEVADDFNYKPVRINNTYGNVQNKLTFSLPCAYSISYNPIAKVVMI